MGFHDIGSERGDISVANMPHFPGHNTVCSAMNVFFPSGSPTNKVIGSQPVPFRYLPPAYVTVANAPSRVSFRIGSHCSHEGSSEQRSWTGYLLWRAVASNTPLSQDNVPELLLPPPSEALCFAELATIIVMKSSKKQNKTKETALNENLVTAEVIPTTNTPGDPGNEGFGALVATAARTLLPRLPEGSGCGPIGIKQQFLFVTVYIGRRIAAYSILYAVLQVVTE